VDAQKHDTESHGKTLTRDYIAYAVQDKALAKLYAAAQYLKTEHIDTQAMLKQINEIIAAKNTTIRGLAKKLGLDASNLAKTLSGRRIVGNQIIQVHSYLIKGFL